jgi:hypothetical protein
VLVPVLEPSQVSFCSFLHFISIVIFVYLIILLTDRVGSPKAADGLGVVLPYKPGDKLTQPKRPVMTGRKKPTKNAIQNKKDMELRSQEAKVAAGATSGSAGAAGAGKLPRMSHSVGGFGLLAQLVVSKSVNNGSSPRSPASLSPVPSFSNLNDATSGGAGTGPSLGGSLQLGSPSVNPATVDFKQLLDPGGPKLLQIKGRRFVPYERRKERACKILTSKPGRSRCVSPSCPATRSTREMSSSSMWEINYSCGMVPVRIAWRRRKGLTCARASRIRIATLVRPSSHLTRMIIILNFGV